MYLVLGNSPKKVILKDLNDTVFYKQKKVYSDSSYSSSKDLQREIQKGNLIIISQKHDSASNTASDEIPMDFSSKPVESGKLDALFDKLKKLEDMIRDTKAVVPASSDIPSSIADKIADIEKRLSENSSDTSIAELLESVKKLETKFESNLKNNELLNKLEELLNRAPAVSPTVVENEPVRPEDIYVPNVTVEDANSHIKLEVRTIETGNSVDDSLMKLKELKSKSK